MKNEELQCSLVITTYNWPEALEKVFQSIAWQTVLPSEVLVADDGSNAETSETIKKIQKNFTVPVKHFWHERSGKKTKTKIDNIAIAHSSYDYLIFIDHDILLHPKFIEDHLTIAKKGYFINGSRFLTNKMSTDFILTKQKITKKDLAALKGINNLNTYRIPFLMEYFADRYKTDENSMHIVRGCNMAFWKKDLIAVNGFDERYQGWGREDSDIAIRLFNNGIRKRSLKFGGIAYHLFHKEGNKTDDAMYVDMMNETKAQNSKWAINGLDKHLHF